MTLPRRLPTKPHHPNSPKKAESISMCCICIVIHTTDYRTRYVHEHENVHVSVYLHSVLSEITVTYSIYCDERIFRDCYVDYRGYEVANCCPQQPKPTKPHHIQEATRVKVLDIVADLPRQSTLVV